MLRARAFLIATTLTVSATGCYEGTTTNGFDESAPASVLQPLDLDDDFAAAAEEFDVPAVLLAGIAWAETRWHMVHGSEEGHPHGPDPAYGVMGLRGERLEDGAELAGVSITDAQSEPQANVRAAAAWLSARADVLGVDGRHDPRSWAEVVADYGGLEHPVARDGYVRGEVFAAMSAGFEAITVDGQRQGSLAPVAGLADFSARPDVSKAAGPDYPDSIWRPSPNNSSRPSGVSGDVQMVIIHSCEGSYSGCWSWLTNSASGVSSHYVVNSTGSEISQLVLESRKAWHIGASYNCNLNDSTLCSLNGYGSNGFTVGVEHAGFASQSSWDQGLIDASAQLVCDITEQYGIPRDANHIVAHGQLQSNRTDPGANWPWDDYIEEIRAVCGDPPSEIIVDSDNANNDPSFASSEFSTSGWTTSSYTPGYWETDYAFATTQPISDGATFWFYVSQSGARTVDAWWTAGSNRSPAAPFVVYNASGTKLTTVFADQRVNGGQWNELGTFNFTAGWNRVILSRWAASGYVVIADAIQVR